MRVNPNSLLAVLVGFTLNLGLSGVAQAALPAATTNAVVSASAYVPIAWTSSELMDSTWSWSDIHGNSAGATATSGPLPSIAVTAHAAQDGKIFYVDGRLEYSFLVSGPNTGINVPILVSGIYRMGNSAGVSSPYASQAAAQVNAAVYGPSLSYLYAFSKSCNSAASNAADRICGDGSFVGTMNFLSGNAGLIRLQTVASVSSAFSYSNIVLNLNADASAYIDPYIEIDPTWALANPGYSISVSQGVGNTAPVPEAETYAMMLAGLGLVGLMARRRKQLEA